MKALTLIIITIPTLIGLGCTQPTSFKSNDTVKVQQFSTEFEKSTEALEDFKANYGLSYSYTNSSSTYFGFISKMEVKFYDNKIDSRSYSNSEQESWSESGDTLGTHEGYTLESNIDDLYLYCKNEVLTLDNSENDIYFSTDDYGVIKKCGFVPKGCMDGCYFGVSISNFQPLINIAI